MCEALKQRNLEVTCASVGSISQSAVKDYDCLIVGSPTIGWAATKQTQEFLEGLNATELAGKFAVAFDTRIKNRMSGQATKGMIEKLGKKGFKIIAQPLVTYVEGSSRKHDYTLKDGELEKAKEYAENLAKALGA